MAENNQIENVEYPILTNQVLHTLEELQSPNGVYDLYISFIRRLEFILLNKGEELDLDDSTALSYIRILYMLKRDLEYLANQGETEEDTDNL